jgi:hypothetical protein
VEQMDIFDAKMTDVELEIFIDETISNIIEYKLLSKDDNLNENKEIISTILNAENTEILFEKNDLFKYVISNSANKKSMKQKNVSFASALLFISLVSMSYFSRKSKCFCKIPDILTEMNNQSNIGFNIIKSNDLWSVKATIFS